jgi:hypothetical protein
MKFLVIKSMPKARLLFTERKVSDMSEGRVFTLISKKDDSFAIWDEMNQERLGEYSSKDAIVKITELIRK